MKKGRNTVRQVMMCFAALVFMGTLFFADVTGQAATKVAKVKGVEAESTTYTSVTVTWKAASNVTGYQVYRSTSKNGSYKKVATVSKNKKLSYTNKKLTTGKNYYYKVRAYVKSGSKVRYGSFSSVVTVKPVPVKTTIASVDSVNYNTVQLKWKSVSGASGYMIYKSTNKTGKYTLAQTVSGKNTVKGNVTGIAAGRTYYFKVRAYRTVSGKKVLGASSSAKKGYCVPEAANIVNVALDSLNSATLQWNFVPGSNGYYVYRSSLKDSGYKRIGTITNKSTKSYTDKSIVKGSTYYYKVSAYRNFEGKKVEGEKSDSIAIKAVSSYKISPSSKPYAGNYIKNANYKSSTKNYFTLLSYMELMEKIGGGEIVLSAGTYNLWKPIYVPSNTTIRFEDGVTIKSNNTSASTSNGLFVLANPTDMEKSVKYSKYNGVHDVKLIGSGTVVFDKEYKDNSALLIGHTRNVTIEGITFKNMNGGAHFIELDASQNVEITNCKFTGYKETSTYKEAINIDTPDPVTKGFSGTYSSQDRTPNNNITISDNVFDNLPVALGTHMYSTGYQHSDIKITGNTIKNCKYYGIRAMNWKDCSITGNTIDRVTGASGSSSLAVEMRGVSNVKVSGNTVKNSDRFMLIRVANYSATTIDSHPGLERYKPVYNSVSKSAVVNNTLSNIRNSNQIDYANTLDFTDREIWSVQ